MKPSQHITLLPTLRRLPLWLLLAVLAGCHGADAYQVQQVAWLNPEMASAEANQTLSREGVEATVSVDTCRFLYMKYYIEGLHVAAADSTLWIDADYEFVERVAQVRVGHRELTEAMVTDPEGRRHCLYVIDPVRPDSLYRSPWLHFAHKHTLRLTLTDSTHGPVLVLDEVGTGSPYSKLKPGEVASHLLTKVAWPLRADVEQMKRIEILGEYEYFVGLKIVADKAVEGQPLPAEYVKVVMPLSEAESRVYWELVSGGSGRYRPLEAVAEQYALADSAGVCEQYLRLLDYSDSGATATVCAAAIRIEQSDPERFAATLKRSVSPAGQAKYKAYRQTHPTPAP